MTIAHVFEYEKGWGAKSVPPPLALKSPKITVSIRLTFLVAKME